MLLNTKVRDAPVEVPFMGVAVRGGEPLSEVRTGADRAAPSRTVSTSRLASVTAESTFTKRK